MHSGKKVCLTLFCAIMCAIKVPREQDKTSCLDKALQLTDTTYSLLARLSDDNDDVCFMFILLWAHTKWQQLYSEQLTELYRAKMSSFFWAKSKLSIIYQHQVRKYCAFSTLFNVDLKKNTPPPPNLRLCIYSNCAFKYTWQVFECVSERRERVFFPAWFCPRYHVSQT